MLLINLCNVTTVRVSFEAQLDDASSYQLYRLQMGPDGMRSHKARLNGKVLELGSAGELPAMPSVTTSGLLTLAPLDIAFVVLPGSTAGPACSHLAKSRRLVQEIRVPGPPGAREGSQVVVPLLGGVGQNSPIRPVENPQTYPQVAGDIDAVHLPAWRTGLRLREGERSAPCPPSVAHRAQDAASLQRLARYMSPSRGHLSPFYFFWCLARMSLLPVYLSIGK